MRIQRIIDDKMARLLVTGRLTVTADMAMGIVNRASLRGAEPMTHSRYPLELVQRVITVGLETLKIVRGLPAMQIQ